jgi:hypothetical protein
VIVCYIGLLEKMKNAHTPKQTLSASSKQVTRIMSRPPASPGAFLRDIQHATTRMKKARRMMSELRRANPRESDWAKAAELSIDSVKGAAMLVAGVTPELSDPDMLLKMIQMQRFATSLLVRARRVKTALASEEGIARLAAQGDEDPYRDNEESDSDDEWNGE